MIRKLVPRFGLPLLLAAVASFVTNFGDKADVAVFTALAEILPVLALAGFVELFPVLRELLPVVAVGQEPNDEKEFGKAVSQIWVYSFVGYLIIGESVSLWALGTQTSSTFLLLAACLNGLLMVRMVTTTHLERYDSAINERFRAAEEKAEIARKAEQTSP